MKLCWIRVSPISDDPETQKTHRKRWSPHEPVSRGWNDATTIQGKPNIASNHHKVGKSMGEFSLEFLEILISGFLSSKMGRNIFICYTSSSWYFVTAAPGNEYKLTLQFCFFNISWIHTLTSIFSIDSNLAFRLSLQMIPLLPVFPKDHRNDKTGISRKSQLRGNEMLSYIMKIEG